MPPLYVASDETLDRISKYVENGGQVVMAFKSGYTNEYSTVRWQRAPGPLRKAAGFSYQEFSTLAYPVSLKPDRYKLGDRNQASTWAEFLLPETAETLATYDHPFFGKFPAITRNRYGKGSLTYEGTALTDELQKAVIRDVLDRAGLTGADQQAPAPVRIRHGRNAKGTPVHFYLNFSPAPQNVTYSYADGFPNCSRASPSPGTAGWRSRHGTCSWWRRSDDHDRRHLALCCGLDSPRRGAPPPPHEPPNIVLIIADDAGYGDLTCYGADSRSRLRTSTGSRQAEFVSRMPMRAQPPARPAGIR